MSLNSLQFAQSEPVSEIGSSKKAIVRRYYYIVALSVDFTEISFPFKTCVNFQRAF